jgi:hypothetical protein
VIVNNYLANIAARTVNPEPIVRPRLSGPFEPPPVLREPFFESRAVNRTRAESHSRIDAVIDSPGIDEPHRRRRRDVPNIRTLNPGPEPAPSDAQPRALDVAVAATSASYASSPPPQSAIRATETKTPSKLDAAPQTTRFDVSPVEDQADSAPIKTVKAHAPEPRPMLRVESRFDEPAPRLDSRRAEAVDEPPLPATPARSPKIAARSLNLSDDDQSVAQRLPRPRPVIDRELETLIIREKSIVGESGLGDASTPKRGASTPPDLSEEREQTGTKSAPVAIAIQTSIVPKVAVVPEPLSLTRSDAQAQPTVRVTIGRIEIRAVQSPQPAVKARGTTPVMNLDDYLRRRNQGGAR